MAKERTSVRMQAQIRILSDQGHSIRSIARILRLSRRTVRNFLEPRDSSMACWRPTRRNVVKHSESARASNRALIRSRSRARRVDLFQAALWPKPLAK